MFVELPATTLSQLEYALEPPAALAAASIAAQNTAGRVWAAGGNTAASTVLWDQGNNVLYVRVARDEDRDAMRRLLETEIREAAVASGLERFGARPLDAASEAAVRPLLSAYETGERASMFWEWPAGQDPAAPIPSLPGLRWELIDRHLLARDEIRGLDDVRREISWMWPSFQRYYEYGLGVAALLGDQVVCWSTSEYMSDDRCGVGIATEPDYRGRGVATATAAAFVREALRRGLMACWECSADNMASARVAAKTGFDLRYEHLTLQGRFN